MELLETSRFICRGTTGNLQLTQWLQNVLQVALGKQHSLHRPSQWPTQRLGSDTSWPWESGSVSTKQMCSMASIAMGIRPGSHFTAAPAQLWHKLISDINHTPSVWKANNKKKSCSVSPDLYFWEIWIFLLEWWNAVTFPQWDSLSKPHHGTHV